MQKIISNKARCRLCHSIAESTARHHLCFCSCGSIYVDGGKEYLRRGGHLEHIEELSEFTEVAEEVTNGSEREKRTI